MTKSTDLTADRAKQLRLDALYADQAAERDRRQVRRDQFRAQSAARAEYSGIHPDGRADKRKRGQPGEHPDSEAPEAEGGTAELLTLPVERGEKTRQRTYTFDTVI